MEGLFQSSTAHSRRPYPRSMAICASRASRLCRFLFRDAPVPRKDLPDRCRLVPETSRNCESTGRSPPACRPSKPAALRPQDSRRTHVRGCSASVATTRCDSFSYSASLRMKLRISGTSLSAGRARCAATLTAEPPRARERRAASPVKLYPPSSTESRRPPACLSAISRMTRVRSAKSASVSRNCPSGSPDSGIEARRNQHQLRLYLSAAAINCSWNAPRISLRPEPAGNGQFSVMPSPLPSPRSLRAPVPGYHGD